MYFLNSPSLSIGITVTLTGRGRALFLPGSNPRLPKRTEPRSASLRPQRQTTVFGCDKSTRRANHFGFSEIVSSPGIKNISLNPPGKSALLVRPSHPMRGALRTSRHAWWDAVDAELAKDERRRSRTAKACGSGTATLVSSSREAGFSGATAARKPVRREEHVISRKPSRREGRVFSAGPVCSCALFFCTIAHETAGAARIRSSLRPLLFTRAKIQANLGHFVPRECGVLSFG